jgi:hypothetical protein
MRNLARLAEEPLIRERREIVREVHHLTPLPWVALGALISGLVFLAAMLLR